VVVTGRAAIGSANRVAELVAALHAELDLRADAADASIGRRPPLVSVYLGGGTPSLLTPTQVGGLVDHAHRRFGIASGAEVTMEANPGAGERGDVAGFRAAGVTRLSIGAQSMQPAELRRLGRRHRAADVRDAVRAARAVGIASVSIDLLIDIPGQTGATWDSTLDQTLDLSPDHLSVYLLTLEDPDADGLTSIDGDHLPLRPGARRWRAAAGPEQDEDRAAAMDARTDERLGAAGLHRYELSNHARPGHQSRHNMAYWRRDPVEAVGPGAHAFDGALTRRWNAARLDRYLAALVPPGGRSASLPPGGRETIDTDTARAESAILGLRLADGIDARLLVDPSLGVGLGWAVDAGLVVEAAGRLVLTPRGRLLSNEVFARLLPDPRPIHPGPRPTAARPGAASGTVGP
jgi:oxygen-independent coproporphyrinogen-3 oxidase